MSAPEPVAAGDPPPEMDAVVLQLAPGQQFRAPPVPCAFATMNADGSALGAEIVSAQQGAACTLICHPGGDPGVNVPVVVTPGGTVVAVVEGGGQPWCLTHILESDNGSSGGMLIDTQCRAFEINRAREASDVKHAVLVNALHVGLGQASPWISAPPEKHGRGVEHGIPPRCVNVVGRVTSWRISHAQSEMMARCWWCLRVSQALDSRRW